MNKRDKIRAGKITTTYDGKMEERYGVFKTREYEAKPSGPPGYFIRHQHDGYTHLVYGFSSYDAARLYYWNLINRLDENGGRGGPTPPPGRKPNNGTPVPPRR